MAAITKRPNGTYTARIRRRGWPETAKTFDRLSDAESWARALEREMDTGSFIKRDDAERTTFQEAAERYKREVLPTMRAQRQPSSMLDRLCERFGKYSLVSISPAILSAYRDQRLKVVGPQTVVHELGLITRVLKACQMDWGIALPQGIPTALVRRPKLPTGRERRLEGNEEALLLEVLGDKPYPRALFILALETAARQSELLSLRWDDVDLQRRTARLRGPNGRVTKNGAPFREVPLTSRAVQTLHDLPRSIDGGIVFPISQTALRLTWDRAVASARRSHLYSLLAAQLKAEGIDGDKEVTALVFKRRDPIPRTLTLLSQLEHSDSTLQDLKHHVRKGKPHAAGVRHLEDREESLILEMLSGKAMHSAVFVLSQETSVHQSELIFLRWSDVHLEERFVLLHEVGIGASNCHVVARKVRLSPRAMDALSELPRSDDEDLVFPISQDHLRQVWDAAVDRARRSYLKSRLAELLKAEGIDGDREVRALAKRRRQPLARTHELLAQLEQREKVLLNLHWHDLRHEATSRLAESLEMHELMKVTGHQSSAMLSRYYHPRAEDLASKLA